MEANFELLFCNSFMQSQAMPSYVKPRETFFVGGININIWVCNWTEDEGMKFSRNRIIF